MNISEFGRFRASFGLIRGASDLVAASFHAWQRDTLLPYGMSLTSERRSGFIADVLDSLYPLTAPIITKHVFWQLSDAWTVYFDNGILGTDAGPPSVLSARLQTDAIRVVMSDHEVEPVTRSVTQYGASIFEFHSNGQERRHVYAANDGGKWKFGQAGQPFEFETTDLYMARSIRERLPHSTVIAYLQELGVSLDQGGTLQPQSGSGYVLTKQGKLPALVREPKR